MNEHKGHFLFTLRGASRGGKKKLFTGGCPICYAEMDCTRGETYYKEDESTYPYSIDKCPHGHYSIESDFDCRRIVVAGKTFVYHNWMSNKTAARHARLIVSIFDKARVARFGHSRRLRKMGSML